MAISLTVSCFSKIQIGFIFLVPADPGSLGKRAVCVCVCVCVRACVRACVCACARAHARTHVRTRTTYTDIRPCYWLGELLEIWCVRTTYTDIRPCYWLRELLEI